jgi:hypothetical protein
MDTIVRILWFSVIILMGVLAGMWAQKFKDHAALPLATQSVPSPDRSHQPKPSTTSLVVPSVKLMTIDEMDKVGRGSFRAGDFYYTISSWYGGDSERAKKAQQLAAACSSDHNYIWKIADLKYRYSKAKDEAEKRQLYHEITRQRIYCMFFENDIARRAGLLSVPQVAGGGAPVSK